MKIPFSALLLAGGRSSRMGTDKALLSYTGKPLWGYQIDKFKAIGAEEILISRSQDQRSWEVERGELFVRDRFEQAGPMGGILAGMERSKNELLMVLAVDLPLISIELLLSLSERAARDCGVVYCSKNFFEPLAAIYPISLQQEISKSLEKGERSMQPLLNRWVAEGKMTSISIPLSWMPQWKNVNSPAEID